jgi:magnesium-transporting ATPase (P-type)
MELLIDILGLALFVNFLLHWFSPIQSWREKLVNKLVRIMVRYRLFFAEPLLTILTCVQCLSFWSSLFYFQNLTYALITSFIAVIIEKILKYDTK